MTRTFQFGLGVLGLAVAASALAACGGDEATVKVRDAMPFVRLKLKNTSPPLTGGHPATGVAVGTSSGRSTQTLSAGPAGGGQTVMSTTPGTQSADTVNVTVTFTGGPTFRGVGAYPGSFISTVDLECGEPSGGTATVNFANGQPSKTFPLTP